MSKFTPGKEYERKFLVLADRFVRSFEKGTALRKDIRQGYLALAPAQVRVREISGEYVLEIKGDDDLEIDVGALQRQEGRLLLETYAPRVAAVIEKTRYVVPGAFDVDSMCWEIDVFKGDNAPLVVAEIEMPRKTYPLDAFDWPDWIGDEVTDDPRFKNKNLAVRPFKKWRKSQQKEVLKRMGA